MNQKKLCIVTHTFLPHVGGIERVVYEQSKRLLKRQQYEPTILTHKNYFPSQYIYRGIKVQCYPSLNIGFRLGIPYPIPNITSYKTFLEHIKDSAIIHAHGHPYLSSLMAARLAEKYSKPFILTQHNTFIEYNGIWDHVEILNDFIIGKRTLRKAKKIITVSNATKNYVLSLGADPEKVETIYNGVDLDRFKIMPKSRNEIRKKLGIPQDAIVATTVRRLVYKNGIDTLLESAKITAQKNPQIIYLVVGEGPDFEEIKTRVNKLGIGKKFLLTGFISDEELPSYYNAADFSILPSKSGEGLPLVGLEAMACGLPLISTDVGGIREVMIDNCGKIIPPNNPEVMAHTTLDFANIEVSKLKERLRQVMVERFSWEKNVNRLTEIYQEII
jgi:glycosyltransferase involved in cell wall biosynthesis